MSDAPAEKRRKVDGAGVGAPASSSKSWREKAVEEFDLRPVPDGWRDSVATGSEDAWRRYHEYRTRAIEADAKIQDKIDNPNEYRSLDDPRLDYLKEWTAEMKTRAERSMAGGCGWRWTPALGRVEWDEGPSPRTAVFLPDVWSPYAVPRSIHLFHKFHRRMRLGGLEFGAHWEYKLVDFEDESTIDTDDLAGHAELCSSWEDAHVEDEGIETKNLTADTCDKMRRHLFGTSSEESKEATCSDYDFLLLLFGSTGTVTPRLSYDIRDCDLGYAWPEWRDEGSRRMLYDSKAKEGDEDPSKPFAEYHPQSISWLRHRVLEITGKLGPVSKHYRAPKPKFTKRKPDPTEQLMHDIMFGGGDY